MGLSGRRKAAETRGLEQPCGNGLFYGNPDQLVKQLVAVGATIAFAGAATFVILKVVDLTIGLRVPESEEVLGLDSTTHGEMAYQL